MRDRGEVPHADGEAGQAEHHQPAQVDPAGHERIDRNRQIWKIPVENTAKPICSALKPAHPPQEQRCQVDRGEDPNAGHEGKKTAKREIAALQCPKIDHRPSEGQAAPDERNAGDGGDPGCCPDRVVAEPVPPWPFFQRVFQASQEHRHQRHASSRRRFSSDRSGLSILTRIGTTMVTKAPGTRLMKNSQCQE